MKKMISLSATVIAVLAAVTVVYIGTASNPSDAGIQQDNTAVNIAAESVGCGESESPDGGNASKAVTKKYAYLPADISDVEHISPSYAPDEEEQSFYYVETYTEINPAAR